MTSQNKGVRSRHHSTDINKTPHKRDLVQQGVSVSSHTFQARSAQKGGLSSPGAALRRSGPSPAGGERLPCRSGHSGPESGSRAMRSGVSSTSSSARNVIGRRRRYPDSILASRDKLYETAACRGVFVSGSFPGVRFS